MLFALIMTVAITSVIVATADVSMGSIRAEAARETEAKARAAIDGANAQKLSQFKNGSIVLAVSDAVPVGSNSANITTTDNSASIPKTLRMSSSTVVNGKTFSGIGVTGQRIIPKPNYYALFVNTDLDTSAYTLVTGNSGANGDLCANGNVSVSDGSTVNGDLEGSGTIHANGTVTGNKWPSAPTVPFPTPVRANYSGAAVVTLNGNQILAGYTFLSAYRLVYINGNLTISGVISGTGTIYVAGNVEILSNMTYATAGSKVAIICEGNLTWDDTATTAVGYYFVGNGFSTGSTTAKTLTRGCIATSNASVNSNLTIRGDANIWTSSTEGTNLKLPGFWP